MSVQRIIRRFFDIPTPFLVSCNRSMLAYVDANTGSRSIAPGKRLENVSRMRRDANVISHPGVVIVFVKKSSYPLLQSNDFARCNDVDGMLVQLALKGCR